MVYELLKENNLCNYYDISSNPGLKQNISKTSAVYTSLDDQEIRKKLLRFDSETRARVTFSTPGMHCSSCIWLLEHLSKLRHGIIASTVNFPRKEVTVDFDPRDVKLSEIASLLSAVGYPPSISLGDLEIKKKQRNSHSRVLKIGIAGFCFGNIMLMSFPDYFSIGDLELTPGLKLLFSWFNFALALPVLLYSASEFFVSAWKTIRYRELNIDAPIALAVAVTFSRSAWEVITGTGMGYFDSMTGIVFFMLVGRFFQDRTYENISFERDYKSYFPIAVSRITSEKEESVPVTQLKPGDKVIIRNGELIPADSILVSDSASLDYSFVTGEAEPVAISKGEKIYAGARQTSGAIELIIEKETSQSYLTQLWNNDSFSKRREEEHKTYIDNINRWFSSAVLLVAFGSAAVWYFVDPAVALNSLTAVLIVACPCTLLLASTFTNASVLRWLGRKSFYLKNAPAIDRIATADVIVFDKTGTITSGPEATIVFEGVPLTNEEASDIASLASHSGHPLSRSVARFLKESYDTVERKDLQHISEIHGKGVMACIGEQQVMIGSSAFAGNRSERSGATEVWVSFNGKVRGRFIFHNTYRKDFHTMAERLKKKYSLQLLSGDNDAERAVLEPVFGDQMYFRKSPQEKLDHIKSLQSKGKKVIMIGDGLNDAGALMQANAGIAVSDQMNNYFPACDAILDGSNFGELPELLSYTRVARRVVIASFIVSALYNVIGVFFSVRGEMSPLIAAILMPASSFSVILITTISTRLAALALFKKG
ncbi:MAG: heavy metal translocating P-type ATPase metal-binding domain-containing protein [Bacteroidia bacterium]